MSVSPNGNEKKKKKAPVHIYPLLKKKITLSFLFLFPHKSSGTKEHACPTFPCKSWSLPSALSTPSAALMKNSSHYYPLLKKNPHVISYSFHLHSRPTFSCKSWPLLSALSTPSVTLIETAIIFIPYWKATHIISYPLRWHQRRHLRGKIRRLSHFPLRELAVPFSVYDSQRCANEKQLSFSSPTEKKSHYLFFSIVTSKKTAQGQNHTPIPLSPAWVGRYLQRLGLPAKH